MYCHCIYNLKITTGKIKQKIQRGIVDCWIVGNADYYFELITL